MFDIPELVNYIQRCRSCLNNFDQKGAKKLLKEFDKKFPMKELLMPFLYERLYLGAELAFRIGDVEQAKRDIEKYLSRFENDKEHKFSLLLKLGQFETITNRYGISTKYMSEALGLAESIDNSRMIAEAYTSLGHLFSNHYAGLGLYFHRKAERIYWENKMIPAAIMSQIKRAFLSFVSYKLLKDERRGGLLNEAQSIVENPDYSLFNPHDCRLIRYIKAFVEYDLQTLLKIIDELIHAESLPFRCQIEENYIGICIEKSLFDEADALFPIYSKDVLTYHKWSASIKEHLSIWEEHIRKKERFDYVPYHIFRKRNQSVTILDILDHYSMQDELWAVEKSVMRSLHPYHAQEGYFEPVIMDNGEARLYPMGLAFNVYYRGQAEFNTPSKPSLFRKGMTPSKQFVERLKYIELKLLLEDYPLTKYFKETVFAPAPDGSYLHLPLAVDVLALAQHYGIKTELMDVTTDKFVAAFFATTSCKDDIYIYTNN